MKNQVIKKLVAVILILQVQIGYSKPPTLDIKKLEILAEQGDANAQLQLGIVYGKGSEVPLNYKKSSYWIEKSVKQGYYGTLSYWYYLYLNKHISENQFYDALNLFITISNEQNDSFNQYGAGVIYYDYLNNKDKGIELFVKSAENGNEFASSKLGNIYFLNIHFRKFQEKQEILQNDEDLTKAVYWFEKAIKQGNKDVIKQLEYLKVMQEFKEAKNSKILSGKEIKQWFKKNDRNSKIK